MNNGADQAWRGAGVESDRLAVALRRGASTLALTVAVAALGSGGAVAQCAVTGTFANAAAFAPFATGGVVNGIISTVNTVNTGSLAQSSAYVGSPPNPAPNQQGAGSWSRIVGGTVETQANSIASVDAIFAVTGVPAGNANINCRTTTSQDFVTSQFGFDVAKHNFGGGTNIHVGLTGGYSDITTKDRTPGQGTFSSESQVPFAGIYGALYAGNVTIDAQARWDFIRSEYTDAVQGLFNQKHDAHTFSFLWNAAYRFQLPNNWFIDPSIGGVWSRTEVDQLSVAGTFAAGDNNGTSPGFLQVNDVKSLLGRASLRVGTTVTTGQLALQPFVVGSVFHEFAGNVRSTFAGDDRFAANAGPGAFAENGVSTSSRVGTYGHIGAGVAGTIIDTGWLGYARVDYRFGENLDGISFNAGARYQFTPPKNVEEAGLKDGAKQSYAAAPVNWTGIYLGYFTGSLWTDNQISFDNGNGSSPDPAGYLIGGTVGANYQHGHLVVGIEGDYGFSDAEGGQACPNGFFFTCTAKLKNLGILAGRVGFTHERALFYFKAGLAVADVTEGFVTNGGPAVEALQLLTPSDQRTRSMSGWAWGFGAEFAFSDKWSAKAEYMHFDLGKERFATSSPINADVEGDLVRVGLNYRIGLHRHYEADLAPLK